MTTKVRARERLAPEIRAERILEVALNLFSHQDFASVTTREIAKAANVNVALIYYYFENKHVLFRAVIEYAIEAALARYAVRSKDLRDPQASLNEWFKVNLELFTPLKNMAQILVAYNNSGARDPGVDTLIRKLYRKEYQILSDCIAAGTAGGQFRAVDPSRAAVFISTHLDGLCFVSMTRPGTDMKKFMPAAWDAIWDYLGASTSRLSFNKPASQNP